MARRRRRTGGRKQTRLLMMLALAGVAYYLYQRSQPVGAVTLPAPGYVPTEGGVTYTAAELNQLYL